MFLAKYITKLVPILLFSMRKKQKLFLLNISNLWFLESFRIEMCTAKHSINHCFVLFQETHLITDGAVSFQIFMLLK